MSVFWAVGYLVRWLLRLLGFFCSSSSSALSGLSGLSIVVVHTASILIRCSPVCPVCLCGVTLSPHGWVKTLLKRGTVKKVVSPFADSLALSPFPPGSSPHTEEVSPVVSGPVSNSWTLSFVEV